MFIRSPLFGGSLSCTPRGVDLIGRDGDPRNDPARSDLAGVRCIDRRPGTRCPGCYLELLLPQAVSSNTIPAVSDPSVCPSPPRAGSRAGSLGLAVHWLKAGGHSRSVVPELCPGFAVSRGHGEPLVPPLIPGAGTGDLFGGAWRIGTLDQLGIATRRQPTRRRSCRHRCPAKSSTITMEHQHWSIPQPPIPSDNVGMGSGSESVTLLRDRSLLDLHARTAESRHTAVTTPKPRKCQHTAVMCTASSVLIPHRADVNV